MNSADTAWMFVACAMVLLMTPGLAFFYGGLVRSKNALNTMMMSFAALGVGGLVWALAGYSLAFGTGNAWIGSLEFAFLRNVGLEASGSIPHLLFMAFQGTFAIITVALISGAVVERMRFGAFVTFTAGWVLLVYAPVCHWVWGGGWLHQLGALDFAGGTVVHVNAAIAAVVAASVVGSRKDYGRQALLPHNVPFVLLGAALLWFGWLGFNGGSALAANESAALAFVNTILAPCAALIAWMILDRIVAGQPTAVGMATGIVVGLVAIVRSWTTLWTSPRRTASAVWRAPCSPACWPARPGAVPTDCSRETRGNSGSRRSGCWRPWPTAPSSRSFCCGPSGSSCRYAPANATRHSVSTSSSTERRPTPRVRAPS